MTQRTINLPERGLIIMASVNSTGEGLDEIPKRDTISVRAISDIAYSGKKVSETDPLVEKLIDEIIQHRLKTMTEPLVVDGEHLSKDRRTALRRLAKDAQVPSSLIVYDTRDKTFKSRADNFRNQFAGIAKENFTNVVFASDDDDPDIVWDKLPHDKREITGSFDIIGDVHGCADELLDLMNKLGYIYNHTSSAVPVITHPDNRRLVLVGDLTDRGVKNREVLDIAVQIVRSDGFVVLGNHDDKLRRWLEGAKVKVHGGLETTVTEFETVTSEHRKFYADFIASLPDHLIFDGGKLVVAHAGLAENLHGRFGNAVKSFALYGEKSGEQDGVPVRADWAASYSGAAMVVHGHTPTLEARFLNNVWSIDTGAVFGNKLTALRYPKNEIVSVPSKYTYQKPKVALSLEPHGEYL